MITITVKLKKYLEEYRNRGFNKKHKSERRNALGMNFDSYARRILALNGHESVHCSELLKQVRQRLQVRNGKMNITTVKKNVKLHNLMINDFIFLMAIVSLRFGHPYLSKTRKYKRES